MREAARTVIRDDLNKSEEPPEPAEAAEDAAAAEREFESAVPQRFAVRDAQSANWVVRHVVEAEHRIAAAKAWLGREVRRAEREKEFFLRRFRSEIETWARKELAKSKGRRKSIDLPGGRVGYRTRGMAVVLDDAAAVLAWARRHCKPAVVTIQRPSKSEINDHFAKTGEVPDGAHVEAAAEVFFIR